MRKNFETILPHLNGGSYSTFCCTCHNWQKSHHIFRYFQRQNDFLHTIPVALYHMMTSVPNRIDFCRQSYQSYGPIKVANEFRINDHCSSLQMLLASVLDPLSPLFMKLIYSAASICNPPNFCRR